MFYNCFSHFDIHTSYWYSNYVGGKFIGSNDVSRMVYTIIFNVTAEVKAILSTGSTRSSGPTGLHPT